MTRMDPGPPKAEATAAVSEGVDVLSAEQMNHAVHSFDDSAAYERFMGRWSRAAGNVFIDWLALPPGLLWLDVGCGGGAFTELVLAKCAPTSVIAVDPVAAQIDHARRRLVGQLASFQIADAQALPFPPLTFDVVAAALAINFFTDRRRAIGEMQRVARPGGLVAGYVWEFASELSPSGPFRIGMRQFGADVADVPGTQGSSIDALVATFARAGLDQIETRTIEVTVQFASFNDFWQAQTPSYSPTTKSIADLNACDRERLMETVRAGLSERDDGSIEYSARANAIKARVPVLQAPR